MVRCPEVHQGLTAGSPQEGSDELAWQHGVKSLRVDQGTDSGWEEGLVGCISWA